MARTLAWALDLFVALVVTLAAAGVVAIGIGGPVRVALAVPLVLVLPGYALVSALFPTGAEGGSGLPSFDDGVSASRGDGDESGIDGATRIVLSVVSSIALVPLVAMGATITPWGVTLWPVLIGVTGLTVLLLLVAFVRRVGRDPNDRFAFTNVPSPLYTTDGRHRFTTTTRDVRLPNVVLVVGTALLLSSVGYAAVNPPEYDGFTELRVATENMTIETETLYRESFTAGQQATVDLVVTNHEGERTGYTAVAVLQRIDPTNESVAIEAEQPAGQVDVSLADGETRRVELDVTPRLAGDDLRFVVYLYRDGAPTDPSPATSYRTIRFGVNVSQGGSASLVPAGISG